MKLLKTIYLLLVVMLMTSCINEDFSGCPTDNVTLTFSYTGDNNNPAMFAANIDKVDLYVFDNTGKLITTKTINKTELTAFQGTELKLDAGDYKIVCWGNANDDTSINATSQSDGKVSHPNYLTGTNIPTNDHLYLGQLNITVPESGKVSGDVPFHNKHINMQVFVNNLGTQDNPASYPIIEMTNLMPQYDILGNAIQPFGTTYYPGTTYDTEHKCMASIYQTLDFTNDNEIMIVVKNSSGEILTTVNLKQYMIDNDIDIDNIEERTIYIMINFTDLGVQVKVPSWISNIITPY